MKRLAVLIAAALLFLGMSALAQMPRGFVTSDVPKPMPVFEFADDAGRTLTLVEFQGKVVLLNVWATWCVPCRKEMPALDRLQAALGSDDFQVVALSVDRQGLTAVKRFYAETGIQHLSMFNDASDNALRKLGIFGIPTTLLIDRQGQELGRLIGPADWDRLEMVAFLSNVIAGQTGATSPIQQKENEP
ncbi:MAG: TlpA family protein disulfide reductase [Pseudomonadota bacterium]